MSEIDNGGPVFPDPGRAQSAKQREVLTDMGMTLRNYFAAKAMAALLSKYGAYSDDVTSPHHICGSERVFDVDQLAEYAYIQADAMIKAGSKP